MTLSVSSSLRSGTCEFRLINPNGDELKNFSWGKLTLSDHVDIRGVTGEYSAVLTPHDAVGETNLLIEAAAEKRGNSLFVFGGVLMIAIACGYVIVWRMRSHAAWRWFWAGAGVWTLGVALKFIAAYFAYQPVLEWSKERMPHAAYLIWGCFYGGAYTGVFEIGVTYLFALWARGMAKNVKNAMAVGIGAGAFEAALLGLGAAIGGALASASAFPVAGVLWLAGPYERLITILFHTASRVFALQAIAQRRILLFWYGFLLMTLVDGIATYAYLADVLKTHSPWWIELALTPIAIFSVWMIRWSLKTWRTDSGVRQGSV